MTNWWTYPHFTLHVGREEGLAHVDTAQSIAMIDSCGIESTDALMPAHRGETVTNFIDRFLKTTGNTPGTPSSGNTRHRIVVIWVSS